MNNRQSHLKNAMLTGLLTVSLAGFTAPVFAKKPAGGNPVQECQEHSALYFAKYDWENGGYVKDADGGVVGIDGDATSGTWSSDTAIDIMIVKGGTLRDPTTYDPAADDGSFDNSGIEGKDISHITFCVYEHPPSVLPPLVKLLATGVNLTATKNGTGVDLTITTTAEPDTAALTILRGDKLDNGGTAISTVCDFPSGGSPYTCTDAVVGNNYRVLETEYDGDLIVYDEVKPKK
jgi:hypothetical protein